MDGMPPTATAVQPARDLTGAGGTVPAALLGLRHEGVIRRFVREHGVDQARAEALFAETLKWLWLARRSRDVRPAGLMLSMHPEMLGIDEMWHAMLLFTRDYAALCEEWFGGFIHHEPAPEGARIMAGAAAAAELTAFYGFIHDELGEATLRAWFEDRRFAAP